MAEFIGSVAWAQEGAAPERLMMTWLQTCFYVCDIEPMMKYSAAGAASCGSLMRASIMGFLAAKASYPVWGPLGI